MISGVGKAILVCAALAPLAVEGPPAPKRADLHYCAQEPPPKPPKGDQEAREKKALELWDQAEKLEKDGKLMEAQQKLRDLRSRFRGTRLYFDRMELISE